MVFIDDFIQDFSQIFADNHGVLPWNISPGTILNKGFIVKRLELIEQIISK